MYSQSKIKIYKSKEVEKLTKTDDKKRLDAIIEGASKLPIENQEYILTTIKGMLFTRNLIENQRNPTDSRSAV